MTTNNIIKQHKPETQAELQETRLTMLVEALKPYQSSEALTCSLCGHGEDVIERPAWVGGAYESSPECRDRQACWNRWNELKGLAR